MYCAFDEHSFVPFLWTLTSAILQFSVILKNWNRSISLQYKYTATVSSLWRILRENFSLCIFPPCAARFSFFLRPSQIFPLHVHPRIVYTKLFTLKLIPSSKFSFSLMFVTVLGSFGTTISVSSQVSSCKYAYTYIINLRDSNTGVRL